MAPIFAGVSDAVWLGLIGLLTMLAKEYFDRRRSAAVAAEVQAVKAAAGKIEEKAVATAAAVEVIHKATNSITQQLVQKTEAEAMARGVAEERAKSDAVVEQLVQKTEAEALARGQLDERARADAAKKEEASAPPPKDAKGREGGG